MQNLFKNRLTDEVYNEITQFLDGKLKLSEMSTEAQSIMNAMTLDSTFRSFGMTEKLYELSEKLKKDKKIKNDADMEKLEIAYSAFVLKKGSEQRYYKSSGQPSLESKRDKLIADNFEADLAAGKLDQLAIGKSVEQLRAEYMEFYQMYLRGELPGSPQTTTKKKKNSLRKLNMKKNRNPSFQKL